MNNLQFYYLPNLGVLKTNLTKELKSKLLEECTSAKLNKPEVIQQNIRNNIKI